VSSGAGEGNRLFKILFLVRRKPGLTHEEFVHYHLNVHSKFLAAAPQAKRFVRKYLRPLADPNSNKQDYDAVLELWFESREQFEAMSGTIDPAVARQIAEDERNFIDVETGVLAYSYEESDSQLPG